MSSDLLSIGLRGLISARKQIDVTGHNISNVNTEGYSRQSSIQVNTATADGKSGYGSEIVDVRRSTSELANREFTNVSVQHSYWSAQQNTYDALESLSQNLATQVNASMAEMSKNITQLATDRDNTSFQQAFTTQQNTFVQNALSMHSQFSSLEESVQKQMEFTVGQINQSFTELSDLNMKIEWAKVSGGTPNDLYDQRDTLLNKLQGLIGGQTLEQRDGVAMFSNNGQMYVFGDKALSLSYDQGQIKLNTSAGQITLNDSDIGGSLLGLKESLQKTKDVHNDFTAWTLSTATLMNQANAKGLTPNGVQGGNLFNVDTIQITGTNAPEVEANGVMQDMSIAYDGTTFAITTKDGTTISNIAPNSAHGFSLTWPSPTVAGSWTFKAPSGIDTFSIASSDVALSNPYVSNNRNVEGHLNSLPLANGNFSLAWNAGVATMTRADGSTITGNINNGSVDLDNIKFDFTSTSGTSDFTINAGRLNNGNLNSFDLNNNSVLDQGKNITSKVGFIAANANNMTDFNTSYKNEVNNRLQQVKGVSLDEEAANLLSYQQAYSAASQVIKLSKDLFDEILGAIR